MTLLIRGLPHRLPLSSLEHTTMDVFSLFADSLPKYEDPADSIPMDNVDMDPHHNFSPPGCMIV